MLSDRVCEHQLLIRHLAALQTRCTATVGGLQARISGLEAETGTLRRRLWAQQVWLVLQTTRLAWGGAGGDAEALAPGLHPGPAAVQVHRVLCQTGCLTHADYWREGDQCRRTGQACDAVAPRVDPAGPAGGRGRARTFRENP